EVGLVLAIRSLVQLFITPLVAKWSSRVGYSRPMIIGCCFLLASTLTFACAQSLVHLVVARCLHGLASSCIIINGLGLVAENHPDDKKRGRMIGRVQGGVALGVVLGYPMGGLLYH
ncbi:Major facilitator superfamily, partial [Trinorchestia longiramus]